MKRAIDGSVYTQEMKDFYLEQCEKEGSEEMVKGCKKFIG